MSTNLIWVLSTARKLMLSVPSVQYLTPKRGFQTFLLPSLFTHMSYFPIDVERHGSLLKTAFANNRMGKTRDLFKNIREGLTNSCEKKRSKRQRRKGKIYPFECRVPKNSKES